MKRSKTPTLEQSLADQSLDIGRRQPVRKGPEGSIVHPLVRRYSGWNTIAMRKHIRREMKESELACRKGRTHRYIVKLV